MAQLERSEDSPLPATAPNILEIRQETDAPNLERTATPKPSNNLAIVEPPTERPVTDGQPLPRPKRESLSLVESFTRSIQSTRLNSDANDFMVRARKAELRGDLQAQAFLESQANILFGRAAEAAPPISSLKDVDGSLSDAGNLIASYFGQATPSVLLSIAAGTLGGVGGRLVKPLLGKLPTLQRRAEAVGAGVTTAAALEGDVRGGIVAQQQADPVIAAQPVEQRQRSANLTTAISLAVESIIPTAIGAGVGRKLGGSLNRSITPDDLLKVNRGAAVRNIGGEGITETTQLALEEILFDLQNPNRTNSADTSDYLDALFAGIAGGIQGHVAGRTLEGLGTIVSQRGGAKGIIDNAFSGSKNKERGSLSSRNIQNQRIATNEFIFGTSGDDVDVFSTFLPDVTQGLKDNNITNVAQALEGRQLAKIQDVELRNRIQAAAILAITIDNPNITDEQFSTNREFAARVLFPGFEQNDALEAIDSMFDVFVDANAQDSSSVDIVDSPETSESNIEFREGDLVIDGGNSDVDTIQPGQQGDPSNLKVGLKAQDVTDIFAIEDQAPRTSKSETSTIFRPAFNNAPWEVDTLQAELDKNPQADIEPITDFISRNNFDPIEYAKLLREDLQDRFDVNRQDPKAVLAEKGIDSTEGTPFTQEEVRASLATRIEQLDDVLDVAENEGGPRAVLSHLKNNYSKGAVKSISPSEDLNLTETDLRDFSRLNRRQSGQKTREATEAGRLFPLIKNEAGEFEIHPAAINTGREGKKQVDGFVAQSIVQTIGAKARSGTNAFVSSSTRDDLNSRRLLQEGISALFSSTGVVGFLDPKSINKKGQVVGPIIPFEVRNRDSSGKEVGDPKLGIPDVPINAAFQKAADPAVTRELNFRKEVGKKKPEDILPAQFNEDAKVQALEEFKSFDKTGRLQGDNLSKVSQFVLEAFERLTDNIPGGIKKGLQGKGNVRAVDNILAVVRRSSDTRTTPEEIREERQSLRDRLKVIKQSEEFKFKPTKKKAATKKQRKLDAETDRQGLAGRDKARKQVTKLQSELDVLNSKSAKELSDKSAPKGSVTSAIEFLDQLDETIEGLDRRIRGYNADTTTIKNRVAGKFNKTSLKKEVFEFHTSDRTKFDTVGEARSFSSKLFRKKKALQGIRDKLVDAKAAADEKLETALDDSPEGGFKFSAKEQQEQPIEQETTFDPARVDTQGRDREPGKKEQKTIDRITKPAKPTKQDTIRDKVRPLSEKRIPPGITKLKQLLDAKFPLGKGNLSEQNVRKNFRVFLTDSNKVPPKDAKGKFQKRGKASPLLSVGVLLKDIEASDIAYLMIGDIANITGGSVNRTSYFNNLLKNSADIYLSSDSKIPLAEFAEFMDTQGYARWKSDPRMFSPTNVRLLARKQGQYERAVADYNDEQGRIEDLIENPGDSLDGQQAAQRARTWGGNDVVKEANDKLADAPSKEEIKNILKDLKEVLARNQQELEAAITGLSDFGSLEARDTFFAYIKNLDFSDESQRARRDLHRTIHGNRRVLVKMRELMTTDKYKLTKEQQTLLETDPDYAIAVAYQMRANGDLQVSDTALNWFRKIVTSFLNIIGITLSHQFGEHIMTAFQTGDLKTISDVRTVYRIETRTFDNALRAVSNELTTLGKKVIKGSTDVLRETRVPELQALADAIQVQETNDRKSTIGFLPSRRMMQGQFNTALSQIADKYTNNELEAGFQELRDGKVTTKAGRAIRDLNTKIYNYLEEAKVQVLNGKRETVSITKRNRRPPLVFNVGVVTKDRTGFVNKLRKVGLSDEQAEEVLAAVLWNDGSIDFSDTKFDLGRPPKGEELYSGLLDTITPANRSELSQYENSDPLQVFYAFIRQATHRAEMTRHLGHNGIKIDQALEIAKVKGLSREQVEFIRSRTIPALLGTLSYNMSPQLRKIQGGILTVQNLAILPLALFASVVDVMGIPLRTGKMSDAWRAFKTGIIGITNPSNDPDFNMAEILGINDGQMLYDRIGDTYNELIDSPFLRKINQKFFLLNGLEGWTKGMRVSAMRSAISYLTDHSDNAKKLNDIGLKKSDLSFTPDGLLDIENNRKVQEAIFKFVDSTVLRPSSAHRPAWGSDPRFLLMWHLKQFTFTFHNVFYKRVAKSVAENGFRNATLIPFIGMIPVMLASDFAKNIIAPSAFYEQLSFSQTVLRAVQRSSMFGIGTFGFDILQDTRFDEYPGTSLLGPTFDSADTFIDSGLSKGLFRLTPGFALTKTWID